MRFVESRGDIISNLQTLERYRTSAREPERAYLRSLIQKGICFVVAEHRGRTLIGPSRFVGYRDNDMSRHEANDGRDGRETNPVISDLLGSQPTRTPTGERALKRLCKDLGLAWTDRGAFGVARKYWLT